MNIRYICVLWLSCISFICCKQSAFIENFGKKYNETRKSVGLPLLPDQFYLSNNNSKHKISWISKKNREINIPQFDMKVIAVDSTGLISEDNVYTSGRWVSLKNIDPDAGDGWEELVIRYHFVEKKWECFLSNENGLKIISKYEAEAFLEKYGLLK
jgi:hypothetical protein